jgi:hypothetical protein
MKALIEKKEQLNEIKEKLESEIEAVGDQIGLSLTDEKIDTDKLASRSTVIQAKLHQLDKELILVDQEIDAKIKADEVAENDRLFEVRKDHLKSACDGIRECWSLQEKLSKAILNVMDNDLKAKTNNDEMTLQARLMIGLLMGDCKIHHVSHAGVASLKKNLFPESELARATSNLRR